jgi:hypothetical protein
MKKQVLKNSITKWILKSLVLLFISVLLCSSCKSRESKIRLIPSSDLVDLLTELYVADGLLAYPPVRARFSTKDSTSNYVDIIKRHGFTKERMDYTIRYYFEKRTDKFENIYDQVLTRLNEKQALLEKEIPPVVITSPNLWNGRESIGVPESGINDKAWFSIPVKDTGNYVLDFNATVYSDDQSINPKVTVFFWHTDSSKTEFRINWTAAPLSKDGQRRPVFLSKKLSDSTFTHIGGWLLDCDPQGGRWVKHAKVENIVLRKTEIAVE